MAASDHGRPLELTDAKQTAICDILRRGHYRVTAARIVDITPQTFNAWIRAGKDAERRGVDDIFFRFLSAVRKAETEAELTNLDKVIAAGDVDYRAAQWWLARKCAGRWSDNKKEIAAMQKEIAEQQEVLNELMAQFGKKIRANLAQRKKDRQARKARPDRGK